MSEEEEAQREIIIRSSGGGGFAPTSGDEITMTIKYPAKPGDAEPRKRADKALAAAFLAWTSE